MALIEAISITQAYREICQDCALVAHGHERTLLAVADGAGGIGSGDLAAQQVVHEIESNYESVNSADAWVDLLQQIDHRLTVGESTVVVLDVRPYGIAGASVGDSQAWIVSDGAITDLTQNQIRKPLLGSGLSDPVGFTNPPLKGILVMGSDGFYNYAKTDEVIRLISNSDFYEITRKCVDLVRLPSGDLWDDVGLVIARNKPRFRTRQTYDI